MKEKTMKIFEYDDIVTSVESGRAFDEIFYFVEDVSHYYVDFQVSIDAIDDGMTAEEIRKINAGNFIASLLMRKYGVKPYEKVLIKIEY